MRVVMLITGEAPFGLAWARAARTAVEVVTVDVRPGGVAPRPDPEVVVRRARVRPKRLTSPVTDRIVERRLQAAVARVEAERGPVDVLHSHFYPSGRYLVAPARRLGIPHVHTEHSTTLTPRAAAHKRLTGAGRRVASRVLGTANATIAVSDYLRDCLVEQGLVGEATVIGNPVDVDRFRPAPGPRPPSGRVVSVGRLEADKRPLVLVEAFARARARLPHLTLELIGDGPARDAVRSRVDQLGVADAVSFAGHLEATEVARRVGSADVFATATQVETFGVAIAEAIAAGTPVAAFAVTAVPELVDRRSGRLADEAGGAPALADAILGVLRRPGDLDAEAMAAGIRRRFAPAVVGTRLAELYERVQGSAGLTPPPPR